MSKLSGGNASIANNDDLIKKYLREYSPQTNNKISRATSYGSVTCSIPSICDNYSSSDSDDSDESKSFPVLDRTNNGSETNVENGRLVSDTESNGYNLFPAVSAVFPLFFSSLFCPRGL